MRDYPGIVGIKWDIFYKFLKMAGRITMDDANGMQKNNVLIFTIYQPPRHYAVMK